MTREASGINRLPRSRKAIVIDGLTEAADLVDGVRRRDLDSGDRVIISTKNSVYSLTARADGSFVVSGGWFEREGEGRDRGRGPRVHRRRPRDFHRPHRRAWSLHGVRRRTADNADPEVRRIQAAKNQT